MVDKFYKLPQDITSRKDLQSSDKLVYSVILDHIGGNNKGWPGIQTLMSKTALARQTVISSIQRLESAGFLEVNRRKRGQSNHYKTSLNIRPLQKPNQSNNCTTGGLKIRPEVVYSLDPNQTDSLNQTVSNDLYSFILKSRKIWHLPQEKLAEYKKTYPELDIEAQLRKAAQWLIDNPAKRKTEKGMPRFLNGWLSRCKPRISGTKPRPFTPEEEKLFLEKNTYYPTEEEAGKILADAGSV